MTIQQYVKEPLIELCFILRDRLINVENDHKESEQEGSSARI